MIATQETVKNFVLIISKCIIDLNAKLKLKSIKFLEEKKELGLYSIGLTKFLKYHTKNMVHKEQSDKFGFKMKNVRFLKDNIKQTKRQATDQEKIFTNSNKGLSPGYKDSQNSILRKQKTQ